MVKPNSMKILQLTLSFSIFLTPLSYCAGIDFENIVINLLFSWSSYNFLFSAFVIVSFVSLRGQCSRWSCYLIAKVIFWAS